MHWIKVLTNCWHVGFGSHPQIPVLPSLSSKLQIELNYKKKAFVNYVFTCDNLPQNDRDKLPQTTTFANTSSILKLG